MTSYRIKRFGILGVPNAASINKQISDQDFKNGNYGQWAKHAFLGVSKNTRNQFMNGTYPGTKQFSKHTIKGAFLIGGDDEYDYDPFDKQTYNGQTFEEQIHGLKNTFHPYRRTAFDMHKYNNNNPILNPDGKYKYVLNQDKTKWIKTKVKD